MVDEGPAEALGSYSFFFHFDFYDTVAHFVVLGDLGRVEVRQEGGAMLAHEVRGQVLESIVLKLDGLELLLEVVLVHL